MGSSRYCPRCGAAVVLDRPQAPTSALLTRFAPDAGPPPAVSLAKPPRPGPTGLVDDAAPGHDDTLLSEAPEADAVRPGRRRTTLLALGLLVVLAVLAGGGTLGLRHVRDGGLREALTASTAAYNPVVDDARTADDLAALTMVADRADRAANRVGRAQERLGTRNDSRARAVRRQLEAEQSVLEALARLGPLAVRPLDTWGSAHRALRSAVDEEGSRRAALADDDAGRISDAALMLDRLTVTVGSGLTTQAGTEAKEVLDALSTSTTTSSLRSVADRAVAAQDAVAEAADALPSGSGKEVLVAYASMLTALSDLTAVEPGDTADWPAARTALTAAVGQLSAALGADGSDVRAALSTALAKADAVVSRAEQGYARYEALLATATATLETDRSLAEEYESAFTSGLATYVELRDALGDLTDEDDPTAEQDPFTAGYTLDEASNARSSLREDLAGLTPPGPVADEHRAILALLDRGVEAIAGASVAVSEAQSCLDPCDFRASSGWRSYLAESEKISKAYALAEAAWHKAMDGVDAEIAARTLPGAPDL